MIRKIINIGNSEGVTIPAEVMRAMKLNAGDKVEVYVGKPGSHVKYFEFMQEFEKFSKQYHQDLKNLAQK